MKQIPFILLFVFLISQVSFAQIYKWVDEKGVTHFTDDMTQVPEKNRTKVESTKVESVEAPQESGNAKNEGEIAPERKEDPFKDRLGRGEGYWKGRVEEWRKRQRELQDKYEVLRAKYNELTDRHNDSKTPNAKD